MLTYFALESRRYANAYNLYKETSAGLLYLGLWILPAELKVNVDRYLIIDGDPSITVWFFCIERKED